MALTQIETGMLKDLAVTDAKVNDIAAGKLTGSRNTPKGVMPAGSVLQVVSNTYKSSDAYALSNTFQQATAFNTNITPTSSSSKVLIRAVIYFGETGAGAYPGIRITKNGSEITAATGEANSSRKMLSGAAGLMSNNSDMQCVSVEYLDSPATTSSITYGIQVTGFSGRTFYINITGNGDANAGVSSVSSMTLMEIAA